jgi:hypothetical protein
MALEVVLVCNLCYYKYSNDNTANYYAVFMQLLIKELVMEKKYEHVSFDAGHEYTTPCQVLMETDDSYFILLGLTEVLVRKRVGLCKVREIKEKVDVYNLVLSIAFDTEQSLDFVSGLGAEWFNEFTSRLIKAGALREGLYEIGK